MWSYMYFSIAMKPATVRGSGHVSWSRWGHDEAGRKTSNVPSWSNMGQVWCLDMQSENNYHSKTDKY